MLRTVFFLCLGLVVAGILYLSRSGETPEPIEFEITTLPRGETNIDEGEITVRTGAMIYNLVARSHATETVTVKVRLGEGTTEGISASLYGSEPIRPTDSQTMRLSVGLPRALGPFFAKLELYADELPGWSFTYNLKGTKIEKLLQGRYLRMEPSGIDLGPSRVGETKDFEFELVNFGDQPIKLEGIEPRDPKSVRMTSSVDGLSLAPGQRHRVAGQALITGQGKRFGSRIDVRSDADNGKILIVNLSAAVRADYDVTPAQLPVSAVYASQRTEYTIHVRSAEGVEPFVVSELNGLDPLFEISKPLSKEPANEQAISIRVRKDALTGPELIRGALRISIEPALVTLKWPFALRVLPPVNAQPLEINFGTVSRDSLNKPRERSFQLVSLPGRTFKVKGARAQQGHVHVRVADHMTGLPWEVIVSIPAMADAGVYRDQILVETDDPDVPQILVPVRAVVR